MYREMELGNIVYGARDKCGARLCTRSTSRPHALMPFHFAPCRHVQTRSSILKSYVRNRHTASVLVIELLTILSNISYERLCDSSNMRNDNSAIGI